MSRLLRLAIAVLAAAAAGCATMTVSSHVERGLDITPYQTFDWGPADALPAGDPRLAKDLFFQDHVEGAIEKGLATLGYQRATSAWPDLLIHYHASIARRINVTAVDRKYGFCSGEDCDGRVAEYEAGTLVIDIVDAHTNKVIWRGWAQDSVEGALDDPDRMVKTIDEAVRRMLERFPRGTGQVPVEPVPVSE